MAYAMEKHLFSCYLSENAKTAASERKKTIIATIAIVLCHVMSHDASLLLLVSPVFKFNYLHEIRNDNKSHWTRIEHD